MTAEEQSVHPPTGRDPEPVRLCLEDFESQAAAAVPSDVWDFVAGGSGDETTLKGNREALDAVTVLPRVLASVTNVDISTPLLTGSSAMPVVVAPMAYQRLLRGSGELAVAAAARDAGIPFVASVLSSYPIEQIAAVGATTWFQVYWLKDRDLMMELIQRAETAGCTALVVTLDVPIMGSRLRDLRNGFTLPDDVQAANLVDTDEGAGLAHRPGQRGRSAVAEHTRTTFDPAVGWADLERLRAETTLPLVVKGILDSRDAVQAADIGVNAVVVSNHGGRQLNGATPSVRALPAVVAAVEDRCQVLVDSGFRSGTDVLRALALGARAVLLGRPVLWGLAVDGEAGVVDVLTIVQEELRQAMHLAGCETPDDVRALRVLVM